jgi:hypothetical protein
MTPGRQRMRPFILSGTAAVAGLALTWGCGRQPAATPSAPGGATVARSPSNRAAGDKLIAGAITAVSRLDDFDEQRAYEQAFDRLTQWSHVSTADAVAWRLDPLVATLRDDLRAGGQTTLDQPSFDATGDVALLRDTRWLADIADAVRGDAVDDLEVALKLFEWTVRSLAIVGDPPMVPTAAAPGTRWFLPGEILLSGRASGPQRSWIFIELLRQSGIDAVMLATDDAATGMLRPWAPAAIIGGEAHLFEPTYGMPIPGRDGRGVATVRDAADDAAVLASLSLPDRPYPVKAADAATLSVLVAADPRSLSKRMAVLDRDCRTRHGMRLAVDADAVGRRAVAALPNADARVELWEFPWETALRRRSDAAVEAAVRRELAPLAVTFTETGRGDRDAGRQVRPLFRARVREFRGDLDGPEGAKAAYLAARPSRSVIQEAVRRAPPEQSELVERLYRQMKEDATYWLGVVTLEEGEYQAAVDYLGRMTLEAAPDSRWTDAARANLGRALEALGKTEEAVAVLREDGSPQRFGSRILADRLEKTAAHE